MKCLIQSPGILIELIALTLEFKKNYLGGIIQNILVTGWHGNLFGGFRGWSIFRFFFFLFFFKRLELKCMQCQQTHQPMK